MPLDTQRPHRGDAEIERIRKEYDDRLSKLTSEEDVYKKIAKRKAKRNKLIRNGSVVISALLLFALLILFIKSSGQTEDNDLSKFSRYCNENAGWIAIFLAIIQCVNFTPVIEKILPTDVEAITEKLIKKHREKI